MSSSHLKESFHNFNDHSIHYVTSGDPMKPTLVFAHGLGGNLDQWRSQIDFFSLDYHVLAFSLQGHGQSSRSNERVDYTIEAYASTVINLLASLSITSCIWVGNSMGGVIAYEVLREKPSLISKIITNGTSPELVYTPATLKLINYADSLLIKLLGFKRYISIAVNASLKDPLSREILTKIFLQTSPLTIIESHQILGNYSYIDTLLHSTIPIIFIQSPYDKDINKAIAKVKPLLGNSPHITFLTSKTGGHILNIECPDTYNQLLESCLK